MSDPDEPPPADEPRRELRARDVLTRSEAELAELEASLDPTELAELSSWFARPSREVVEEQIAAAELETTRDARQIKLDELTRHVDPRMIAVLERHDTSIASYYHPVAPPRPIIDPTILQIHVRSPEEQAEIAEGREYQRSPDVGDDLEHSAPQAVLRDLFRPVTEYTLQFTSPFFGEDAPPPEDPWIEIRAALRERRPMPGRLDTYAIGAQAKREFRHLTAGSWVEKVEVVKALHAIRDGVTTTPTAEPADGQTEGR